jgi:hypothetical protein
MLRHPTLTTLETLKLTGMATALAEQLEMPDVQRLSFEERLGLLVDGSARSGTITGWRGGWPRPGSPAAPP